MCRWDSTSTRSPSSRNSPHPAPTLRPRSTPTSTDPRGAEMPRVVLAPAKFKGTLTAAEVAQHLADGLRSRRPDVELVTVPVADGGDGIPAAFETAGLHRGPVDAADAIGVVRPSRFVRRGRDAVIELAAVAGLARLRGDRGPATPRDLGG